MPTKLPKLTFSPTDVEETAKAAGAELDHAGKTANTRKVRNSAGDMVTIVSEQWGDYENRDHAFIALAYVVRNRVTMQNQGKAIFNGCSKSKGAPATPADCAQSPDFEAYWKNRAYKADQHEKELAEAVLGAYEVNVYGGAVFFNSDGNTPPGTTFLGSISNFEYIDPVVLDEISLKTTTPWTPPDIARFFFYGLD